jgi:hypothetical protein
MKRLQLRRHSASLRLSDKSSALSAVLPERAASQEQIRVNFEEIGPEGVTVRSRHRLQYSIYNNKGQQFLIHIDGCEKLKPSHMYLLWKG